MTLKEDMARMKKDSKEEFESIRRSLKSTRAHFNKRLKPLEAHLLAEAAVDEGKKKGTISISEDVWNIVKWLVLIIGALVGVNLI